ncbi:MAG: hypothetical protein LBT74_05835 [Acidobacteriota bacterium]|jgi:Flp pilus assembly protein TadD|nr:hypothetical protein [Acidobacteriota bacterium]
MKTLKHISLAIALLLATGLAQAALAQGALQGRYRFVKDSDGRVPNAKATITIDFASGRFNLLAEMPGTTVTDDGTYSVNGGQMTIKFNEMEQGERTGAWSLSGGKLTLPFQMLDADEGSSEWQAVAEAPPSGLTALQVIDAAVSAGRAGGNAQAIDDAAQDYAKKRGADVSEGYYMAGMYTFFSGRATDALYALGRAAQLQNRNGLYLSNLSYLVHETGKTGDAITLGVYTTRVAPTVASGWGNTACFYFIKGRLAEAEAFINRAIKLDKGAGVFRYTKGKILARRGQGEQAKKSFVEAWDRGYAGQGREAEDAIDEELQNPETNSPNPQKDSEVLKQKDWAGRYQAKYICARSGETPGAALSTFGKGMAQTSVTLQTLACVTKFTMEISESGTVVGSGEIMYMYNGGSSGLAGGLAAMASGGGAATLKGGKQTRPWDFKGTVSDDGSLTLTGLPPVQLDLVNVGKAQKIDTWSPLPPDAAGKAMRGPFHLSLLMNKENEPFIHYDKRLPLNDRLIREVHYTGYIFRTEEKVTPVCDAIEAPPKRCPVKEYIKVKTSLSGGSDLLDFELGESTTYTAGGGKSTETESNLTMKTPEALGGISAGAEVHPDGSYELSIGIGTNLPGFGKLLPFTESVHLIYDSNCGFGVKGVLGLTGPVNKSIEGVIFLNKGL